MQIILTMTPQGAAEYLRASGMSISPDTLRRGIEQGVYPFGLCIKTDGSAVYQIFKRLLDEWIAERAVEQVPSSCSFLKKQVFGNSEHLFFPYFAFLRTFLSCSATQAGL